jgi:hypothetical protein
MLGGVQMDVNYYRMKPGQEGQVTLLIHGLIADYGSNFKSKLTAQSLIDNAGFLNVEVAECEGRIMGICAWVMSFSTWRGTKGMYVADLCVTRETNSTDVARKLLHLAATSGASLGATFIRTEVDISDERIEIVYSQIGFWNQLRHMIYFLEPAEFQRFVGGAG